ncbi:MAG: hypothetical protein AB1689_06115 [Thermodesulfobacteriota bacterium]
MTEHAASLPDFSADELRTLAALLDEIVPPSADGRLPGGGTLVGSEHLEATLRLLPGLDLGILQAVKAADEEARKRDAASFAALPHDARLALLGELGARDPGFLPSLTFLAYASYYQDARVLGALGFEARPPHPEGFTLDDGDLELLAPVRRRGKLYRDA